MKPSPHFRCVKGFTLIELLVTISLLSIVLLLATQVAQSARNSIQISESRSNADAEARRIFGQLDLDLSEILIRPDARIEFETRTGDDRIAFLTGRRGYTAGAIGERMASLVSYQHDGQSLLRGSRGNQFDDSSGDALNLDPSVTFPVIAPDHFQSLSSGVLRFEVEYLVKAENAITLQTAAPATTENLKGIVVTLLTLDLQRLRSLDATQRTSLSGEFPDATDGGATLERWNGERDQLARNGLSRIPREVLQSIRCYQRTFLLP